MLGAKCLRCSQTAIVTKFPLRALFLLPNIVLPKLRAVTVEAHLSDPQASELPLKLSMRLTYVIKVFSKKVLLR